MLVIVCACRNTADLREGLLEYLSWVLVVRTVNCLKRSMVGIERASRKLAAVVEFQGTNSGKALVGAALDRDSPGKGLGSWAGRRIRYYWTLRLRRRILPFPGIVRLANHLHHPSKLD